MPQPVRSVMVDFVWSHQRLWALDAPAQRVAVDELRWHLALPMWSFEAIAFVVSPEEVRADPSRYWAQYARTMAADLDLPLQALERPGGHLTVLDGIHRLLKADLVKSQDVV